MAPSEVSSQAAKVILLNKRLSDKTCRLQAAINGLETMQSLRCIAQDGSIKLNPGDAVLVRRMDQGGDPYKDQIAISIPLKRHGAGTLNAGGHSSGNLVWSSYQLPPEPSLQGTWEPASDSLFVGPCNYVQDGLLVMSTESLATYRRRAQLQLEYLQQGLPQE